MRGEREEPISSRTALDTHTKTPAPAAVPALPRSNDAEPDWDAVLAAYNAVCAEAEEADHPRPPREASELSGRQRKQLLELAGAQPVEQVWDEVLETVRENDWLSGRTEAESGWRLSLSWLLRADNWAKVCAGEYAARQEEPLPIYLRVAPSEPEPPPPVRTQAERDAVADKCRQIRERLAVVVAGTRTPTATQKLREPTEAELVQERERRALLTEQARMIREKAAQGAGR